MLFRLELRPRPAWRAYGAPSDSLAGFKGSYFLGEGWERKGMRREGKERA